VSATDLQTGISRLAAVQIADGCLYYDDAMQTHYVVATAAVEAAGRMEPWDYSAWCAEHDDADEATSEQLIEAGIALPVAVQRVAICQCGEALGAPCSEPAGDDAVVVEWMPEWLRDSHAAAGNSGSYPANGAERLRCAPACAEALLESEGDWARAVRS